MIVYNVRVDLQQRVNIFDYKLIVLNVNEVGAIPEEGLGILYFNYKSG